MYPTIASRLRAGLVVLIVALFIQLVSAVPLPVPAPQSATLSSRSNHAGLELIGRDTGRINGPISTASAIAGTLAARVRYCLSSNTVYVGLPSYCRTLLLTRTMSLYAEKSTFTLPTK